MMEGTYVNEGDLIAHIKSTDLDMQQDSIQSQLDIYKKQKFCSIRALICSSE